MTKYICVKDFYAFEKGIVYELPENDWDIYYKYLASMADYGALILSNTKRILTNRQQQALAKFLEHFIPLSEYRNNRINEILE